MAKEKTSPIKQVIQLKPIKKVPESFIRRFCLESGANESYAEDVKAGSVNFGAFDGRKLVGFISGSETGAGNQRIIAASAIYVLPEYRGLGMPRRLLFRQMAESKKRKLGGIVADMVLPPMQRHFMKIKRRYGVGKGAPLNVSIHIGNSVSCASVMFRKKNPARRLA